MRKFIHPFAPELTRTPRKKGFLAEEYALRIDSSGDVARPLFMLDLTHRYHTGPDDLGSTSTGDATFAACSTARIPFMERQLAEYESVKKIGWAFGKMVGPPRLGFICDRPECKGKSTFPGPHMIYRAMIRHAVFTYQLVRGG